MNHDERMGLLDRHAVQLREHFSSVQIIAVRHDSDDDGAVRFTVGRGSWYERFAAMLEIVEQDRARYIRRAEREVDNETEDGDL